MKALQAWPALEGELPAEIQALEARWQPGGGLAAGGSWREASSELERWIHLLPIPAASATGAPGPVFFWRGGEPSCLVVEDTLGETGGHRLLGWRPGSGQPAALGALQLPALLLRSARPFWQDGAAAQPAALAVDPLELGSRIDAARNALLRAASQEALAAAYGALLSGAAAVPLVVDAPLSAEALAGFLLPLPRSLADTLTIRGWPPAAGWEGWGVIATPAASAAPAAALAGRYRERGRRLAAALAAGRPPSAWAEDSLQLVLWGPSAAGKTALLAQLHLQAGQDTGSGELAGWDTYPGDEPTRRFFDAMRRRLTLENRFPPATAEAAFEPLRYTFRERATGFKATLCLEDRAGVHSERLDPEMQERMAAAEGLVLLFDPGRDSRLLRTELLRTLDLLQLGGGDRDRRPLAFCLSKADLLIATAEDWSLAHQKPDFFVRRYLESSDPSVLRSLERYCALYRLFPVAAAEMDVVDGWPASRVFLDEKLEARILPGGRSLPLAAPFLWIFEQLRNVS
jgi:hypothetical protein